MDSLLPDELRGRDHTLVIDKSGRMSTVDRPGGKTRWAVLPESTLAIAREIETINPDLFSPGLRQTLPHF